LAERSQCRQHFGSFANAATTAGLIPRGAGTQHANRSNERHANRHIAARASASQRAPGIDGLAHGLVALADARRAGDPVAIHAALVDIAGSALAWAEAFTA
jgi:hypothetical protein